MSILGLRSRDWSRVMDYSHLGVDNNMLSIVNYFNNTFQFDNDNKSWWIDQVYILKCFDVLKYKCINQGWLIISAGC